MRAQALVERCADVIAALCPLRPPCSSFSLPHDDHQTDALQHGDYRSFVGFLVHPREVKIYNLAHCPEILTEKTYGPFHPRCSVCFVTRPTIGYSLHRRYCAHACESADFGGRGERL